jgi:hypothetical protein
MESKTWCRRLTAHEDTMKSATNLAASARDYPAKPVRIIDPFGAGPICWPVPWPRSFLSCGANP